MFSNFIPSYHYFSGDKLSDEFFRTCMDSLWFNARNKSLLWDKNIKDIEEYTSGQFDLTPFKKWYRRQVKNLNNQLKQQGFLHPNGNDDMDWHCLALITGKFNAGTALIMKIPVEVTVKALDPLATKKKKEDVAFIKNKPEVEADLQTIADQFNVGKVDIGTTTHSSIAFGDNPYGLDLNEPDELDVFVNLLYALKVEAALETILQIFWELTKANQVKLLEIRDQFKFGVSCNRSYQSSITELPQIKYIYPDKMIVPRSELPDFSDNECRFIRDRVTATELMNYFGDEITSKKQLEDIINNPSYGYCYCNGRDYVNSGTFDQFKINIIYCEIKSIDSIGVVSNPKKSKYSYLTVDKDEMEKDTTEKLWGQNTYCGWWLENTNYFFGKDKLPYAYRAEGLECYQTFSTNIYKSQERSAIELSIGENKVAQEAYIKLQHFIRKATPPGKAINLKPLRNALEGLTDENNAYSMMELLRMAYEDNQVVYDTEGFDNTQTNFKVFEDLPGGVSAGIANFYSVIQNAKTNIGQFMGINDQVTGQGVNPEGLVGLQKLLVNASINSISYVNDAIEEQIRKIFYNWTFVIKDAVEDKGKARKAIVSMIGAEKTNLIDGIEDMGSHQMNVKISMTQREEERQAFLSELLLLKQKGVINTTTTYMISAVTNPNDKLALLAVAEKKWEKKQDQIRQENYAQQQQLMAQQGKNVVASKNAEAEGDKNTAYAKGEVDAKLLQLEKQLDAQQQQIEGFIKKDLQKDRNESQLDKSIKVLETKANLESAKSLV